MNLSRDLMLGMLRKGGNGNEILNILNVIVDDVRDQVCEDLGIANCPENEGEIADAMINF